MGSPCARCYLKAAEKIGKACSECNARWMYSQGCALEIDPPTEPEIKAIDPDCDKLLGRKSPKWVSCSIKGCRGRGTRQSAIGTVCKVHRERLRQRDKMGIPTRSALELAKDLRKSERQRQLEEIGIKADSYSYNPTKYIGGECPHLSVYVW